MKYLKYFKTDVDYKNYFNYNDFVTPNVYYVEDVKLCVTKFKLLVYYLVLN